MNIRKIIQFIALGLMLVILPLGSWVYLRKGYNERKEALDQLSKYEVALPDFRLSAQDGKNVSKNSLKGAFAVLGKVDKFSKDDPVIQASEGLFEEFGSSLKMSLLTHVTVYDSTAIVDYLEEIRTDTVSKWHFLQGTPDFDDIFKDHSSNHLALIDTFGVVRNYYDATSETEIADMAKHMAMFVMPLLRKGDLVYKREEEK
ncbi:MAG: hypothetical protein AAF847_16280 [Bacteroidota bacterium]